MEIQSAKLIITVVDETTGELITREATLGDFKEVTKKTTTTRTKKPKDTDPVAKLILLEGKLQMNNAAVELTGFEPEMKIDIKFEKKGRNITPVMMEADSGNRLTKTYTISCRGSKHDNLAEYGDVFEVIPYDDKPGYFKLKGNSEKEDDIVDVPEEIANPEEFDTEDEDGAVDMDDFDLDLTD
jgi:hypothetical protein